VRSILACGKLTRIADEKSGDRRFTTAGSGGTLSHS
jgi:hypothetical protein